MPKKDMTEQEWIQQNKMDFKLEKIHWEKAKVDNINLILMNTMQIEMAKEVLKMVEKKLAEFPTETEKKPAEKK